MWSCTGCGKRYPFKDFSHLMDDEWEQVLANIRVDRL